MRSTTSGNNNNVKAISYKDHTHKNKNNTALVVSVKALLGQSYISTRVGPLWKECPLSFSISEVTVILMSIATYVYIDGILLSESSSTMKQSNSSRVTTSTSAYPSPSYIASNIMNNNLSSTKKKASCHLHHLIIL